MNKTSLCCAFALAVASQSVQALPIPMGATLFAQNSFSGVITNVILDTRDGNDEWHAEITPGGVDVGTEFNGEFVLYRDPVHFGALGYRSRYRFNGISQDYMFDINAGPDSSFGGLEIFPNQIFMSFSKHFDSDGLEDTFNHGLGLRHAYGYFTANLFNYSAPSIYGLGSFGFAGVDVMFDINPPENVAEPSLLGAMFGSFLLLAYIRRKKQS